MPTETDRRNPGCGWKLAGLSFELFCPLRSLPGRLIPCAVVTMAVWPFWLNLDNSSSAGVNAIGRAKIEAERSSGKPGQSSLEQDASTLRSSPCAPAGRDTRPVCESTAVPEDREATSLSRTRSRPACLESQVLHAP